MKLALTLLIIQFYSLVFAQGVTSSITGSVSNAEGDGIGYVTIIAYSSDTSIVVGSTNSNEAGVFTMTLDTVNEYMTPIPLRVSAIGYGINWFEVDVMKDDEPYSFTLNTQSVNLESIEVTDVRPLIVQRGNKTILDVEALLGGVTVDMTDLLLSIPGLSIDPKNNIRIDNKLGVQILRNGRRVNLSGDQLVTFLSSQSIEDLKYIEISTNPSAKYDAQGSAAIVDLKYDKSTFRGWSADLSGNYGNGYTEFYSAGIYSKYNNNDFRANAYFQQSSDEILTRTDVERKLFNGNNLVLEATEVYDDMTDKDVTIGSLGLDYILSKESSIGIMGDYIESRRNILLDSESLQDSVSVNSSRMFESNVDKIRNFSNSSINAHYSFKDKDGKSEVYTSADYYFTQINSSSGSQSVENRFGGETERINTLLLNPEDIRIFTVQSDITKYNSSKSTRYDFGAKFSRTMKELDYKFDFMSSSQEFDQQQIFTYTENIPAIYLQVEKEFTSGVVLSAGLRYEYTDIMGGTLDTVTVDNEYSNLFPSASLSKKFENGNSVAVSFSQRIDRPRFSILNPFEFFETPYRSEQGFPVIQPSTSNNIEVRTTLGGKYNLKLARFSQSNAIRRVLFQRDDGGFISSFRNLQDFESYEFSVNIPVNFKKWLRMYLYTSLSRSVYKFNDESNTSNSTEQNSIYFSLSQNVKLPGSINMRASFSITNGAVLGVDVLRFRRKASFRFSKNLFSGNGRLSLHLVDPFNLEQEILDSNFDNQISVQDSRYFQRRVELGFSYTIRSGRQERSPRVKSSNRDEKSRL